MPTVTLPDGDSWDYPVIRLCFGPARLEGASIAYAHPLDEEIIMESWSTIEPFVRAADEKLRELWTGVLEGVRQRAEKPPGTDPPSASSMQRTRR